MQPLSHLLVHQEALGSQVVSPNPSPGLVFLESASPATSEQGWCHRPSPWRWGRAHGPPPTCSEKQRLICGPAAFSSTRRRLALSSCCTQTVDDISAIRSGEILHTHPQNPNVWPLLKGQKFDDTGPVSPLTPPVAVLCLLQVALGHLVLHCPSPALLGWWPL